jgi:hypothetical protein
MPVATKRCGGQVKCGLTLILLMWRIGWTPNSISIYIQQDATLHNLFISGTALHVSGGISTQHQERIQLYLKHLVFVTPFCRYRGRVGSGLSVLWVAYATHSTLKPIPTLPRYRQIAVTVWQIPDALDTVVCAPDVGWKYHPKHVEQFQI